MDSERILGSVPAPLSIDQSGVFLVIASRPKGALMTSFKSRLKSPWRYRMLSRSPILPLFFSYMCRLSYCGIAILDAGITICDLTLLGPSSVGSGFLHKSEKTSTRTSNNISANYASAYVREEAATPRAYQRSSTCPNGQ